MDKPTPTELKLKRETEDKAIRRVLDTTDGQIMFRRMKAEFDESLLGNDTHETYLNMGMRHVVKWLETIYKRGDD